MSFRDWPLAQPEVYLRYANPNVGGAVRRFDLPPDGSGSATDASTDTPASGHGYLHNFSASDKSPCGERACPALGRVAAPKQPLWSF